MKGLFLVFLYFGASQAADCVWNRKTDFGDNPGLLVDINTNHLILPKVIDGETVISVSENQKFLLACPGKKSKIRKTKTDVEEVTCTGDNKLKIGTKTYSMKEVGCTNKIKSEIDRSLKNCTICSTAYQYYSIGFRVDANIFYDMIYFRFNKIVENVIVTVHIVRGENVASSDKGMAGRPAFKSNCRFFSGYSQSPNKYYEQKSQKNFPPLKGYYNKAKSHYLARGHMAPDADFPTNEQALATYKFVNVGPQWQSFNNGNWKLMEIRIRKLAIKLNSNLHIWTGPSGILSLRDKNNNDVEIYLGKVDKDIYAKTKVIPVADRTWKIVYEPSTDRGVAIIGENNPFLESFPAKTLCTDVSDQIKWMKFDTIKNVDAGAMYCCSISDFVKNFDFLQQEDFVNAELLTE